jgi:hypothetical protein
LRVEAGAEAGDDVVRARPSDRVGDGGNVVEPRHVADADRLAGDELEAEEVLERTGEPLAPLGCRHARQRLPFDEDLPRRRFVELAEQLDQCRLAGAVLTDERHHRAGGKRDRHVVEHEA